MIIRLIALTAVILFFPKTVLPCSAAIRDPLNDATHGAPLSSYEAIYEAEIVGLRDTDQLRRLVAWRHARQKSDNDNLIAHFGPFSIIVGGWRLQIEVFPINVLHGSPSYPEYIDVGGCGPVPVTIGDSILVFSSTTGEPHIRIKAAEDDASVLHSYNDAYVANVQACLKGNCPVLK